MAIGTPVDRATLTGSASGSTTSSITIPSGHEIRVLMSSGAGGSPPDVFTISDTQGLTWIQIANATHNVSNPRFRATAWRATSNGNATQITLTPGANAPGSTGWGAKVISISGAAAEGANTGIAGDSAGDPNVTLASAPESTSVILGICHGGSGTNPITQPAGYTEGSDQTINAASQFEYAYKEGSASQSAQWNSTNSQSIGMLVEVKVGSIAYTISAAAGSYTILGAAATLRCAYRLASAASSYTSGGTAAVLRHGRKIIAAAGSYVWTGTGANLLRMVKLAAAAGAQALSGAVIILRRGYSLDAGSDEYRLAGDDLQLLAALRQFVADETPPDRTAIIGAEARAVSVAAVGHRVAIGRGAPTRLIVLAKVRERTTISTEEE